MSSEKLPMPAAYKRLNWTDPMERDQVFYLKMLAEVLNETITNDQLRWVALNRLYVEAVSLDDQSAVAYYDEQRDVLRRLMLYGEPKPPPPSRQTKVGVDALPPGYRRLYLELVHLIASDRSSRDAVKAYALRCLIEEAMAGSQIDLVSYYQCLLREQELLAEPCSHPT